MRSFSANQLREAAESLECIGFCRACGEEAFGVEPDACGYQCESCGAHEVFGAEELILMGHFSVL